MSVSLCLHHPVAVSTFIICRGLSACIEMLWMCVLYVSFGSKVRPRTFGCVAMSSVLLFILDPECSYILQDLFVLCVAGLTVFVNCLVKQFAICLDVFAILLVNVMDLLSVVGGALLNRPCMAFQRMCVLCLWSQWASGSTFHMFCLCFCMSEVISSFRSLRARSQVFCVQSAFLYLVNVRWFWCIL